MTINVKNKPSNNELSFKEWHQEIWSGVDISTIIFWLPFSKNNSSGQIAFIKGSNKRHIPHRNREPLNLPKILNL